MAKIVDHGSFAVPSFDGQRTVRVALPQRYGSHTKPHPLLVLFDGQNVFDDASSFAGGWRVHEMVEQYAGKSKVAPIVVGVNHSGIGRIDELSPFPAAKTQGKLNELLHWIADSLIPDVRSRYHTEVNPKRVVIGGSSMGGLAAIYSHFRRPDVFGGAIAMSPALWITEEKIYEFLSSVPLPDSSRVYLDCGVFEARGMMMKHTARAASVLAMRGYDQKSLLVRFDRKGQHHESHWRRRMPKALRFVFSEKRRITRQ